MAQTDQKLRLLQEYILTRRRICEIERKAMSKLGEAALPNGPFCSFCSAAESEVEYLVRGVGDAYICQVCVQHITDTMRVDDGT